MIAIGLSSGFAGAGALAIFIITIVFIQLLTSLFSPQLFDIDDPTKHLEIQKACTPSVTDSFDIIGMNPYHIGVGIANMIFTFVYSIMAMFFQNNVNVMYIVFFIGIISHYIYQLQKQGCFTIYLNGVILLGVLGAVFGFVLTPIFAIVEDGNLLMFQKSSSNNKQCGKEGGKRFKCKVYKNGKLIQ